MNIVSEKNRNLRNFIYVKIATVVNFLFKDLQTHVTQAMQLYMATVSKRNSNDAGQAWHRLIAIPKKFQPDLDSSIKLQVPTIFS